jgi:hypothetical protein
MARDRRSAPVVTIAATSAASTACPADGLPVARPRRVLSFEEIERLVALFASMGVRDCG